MTHLSMEALLGLRDRVSEPGNAAAREHLQGCSSCQMELERLHQRVAQLKVLPTLRPPRDGWSAVTTRVRADRWRRRGLQAAGLVGLAMAASLAITVVTHRSATQATVARAEKIHQAQARSKALEHALNSYRPDARVLDGQTATIAHVLENRIAEVDRAIEKAGMEQQRGQEEQVLQLWQERVGLLDVLVNVHLTRASHVEF